MLNKVTSLTKYLKKRKKIGKHLITFSVILSSLFIIENVKASTVLVDGSKYEHLTGVITDENIEHLYSKNNIDKSIYDVVNIFHNTELYSDGYYSHSLYIVFFNSEDFNNGYIIKNSDGHYSYTENKKYNVYRYYYKKWEKSLTTYNLSNIFSNLNNFTLDILKPSTIAGNYGLTIYNSTEKRENIFEQDIDVTKVEKIEFKYRLPQNISQNVNLQYDITNSLDGEEYYFPSPYFDEEYTYCNSETQTCSPKTQHRYFELYDTDPSNILIRNYLPNYFNYTDSIYSSSSSSERYDKLLNRVKLSSRYYVKSFDYLLNADTEYTVENLTMVLDFSLNYQPITAHVKVSSSVDFDVVIHYRSDEDSSSNYYKIVDITGKYGAIFLPKVDLNIEGDASYKSLFKVTGDVEFQQRDSRIFKNSKVLRAYTTNLNSKVCNEKNNSPSSSSNLNDFSSSKLLTDTFPYGCSKSGLFEIYINNKMLQQSIVVINNNYSIDMTAAAAIIYDSRYYNYAIYDTSYDKKTIIDPTTGEEVEISISDFKKDNTDMDPDLIRSTIKTFLKPISYITNSINNFYTNYMPQPLQQFLYFIFGLTVIIIVIKIIF